MRVTPPLLALIVLTIPLAAQAPRSVGPAFHAASVKRNTSGSPNSARNLGAGGRMVFTNFSLPSLVAAAYEVEEFQVTGGPSWMSTERFDIIATAGTPAPLPQLNVMLRALLAERFALEVHTEERERRSYVLLRARDDGQLGAGLKRATADCGPTGRGAGPGPTAGCSAWLGPGTFTVAGQPMSQLAHALGMMLRETVVDQTGLDGGYDFELKFSIDGLPGTPTGPPGTAGPASDPNAPTVFAALREQLGLRLESRRTMVPFVVIDSGRLPTAD
jgi:uncharacterized protein (TIGR03435 family)